MSQVFCKYCRYVRDAMNCSIPETNCSYPPNVIGQADKNQDDFFQPNSLHRPLYLRTANEINKNNGCPWYKYSFWKGW